MVDPAMLLAGFAREPGALETRPMVDAVDPSLLPYLEGISPRRAARLIARSIGEPVLKVRWWMLRGGTATLALLLVFAAEGLGWRADVWPRRRGLRPRVTISRALTVWGDVALLSFGVKWAAFPAFRKGKDDWEPVRALPAGAAARGHDELSRVHGQWQALREFLAGGGEVNLRDLLDHFGPVLRRLLAEQDCRALARQARRRRLTLERARDELTREQLVALHILGGGPAVRLGGGDVLVLHPGLPGLQAMAVRVDGEGRLRVAQAGNRRRTPGGAA